MLEKLTYFLNNKKNFHLIFFSLAFLLALFKIPLIINSEIQPWDEGLYATRVLSIHINGDFWDQTSHSVGGFYSSSHPPLVIWIGYLVTSIFGVSAISLKLTIFVFAILTIYVLIKLGSELLNQFSGIIAGLIFSSNIIFDVFSQRFQLDIHYTFFLLLSFYLFSQFYRKGKRGLLYLSALSFGLCLMTKILVGFFIPIVISIFFLLDRKMLRLSQLILYIIIGLIVAAPWHIYMILKYGNNFIDYFFFYHIVQRAFEGVEHNVKQSNVLYYFNYIFSIIPYSIIFFIGIWKYIKNYKNLNWEKKFLIVWSAIAWIIISSFKTKLEAYIMLALPPVSLVIADYLNNKNKVSTLSNQIIWFLLLLNVFWFVTYHYRSDSTLRYQYMHQFFWYLLIVIIGYILVSILFAWWMGKKLPIQSLIIYFIFVFFVGLNFTYLVDRPEWENTYRLSKIRNLVEQSNRNNVVYIGSDFRFNPQFSFYFEGLNLTWDKKKYNFMLLDTKVGIENVYESLKNLPKLQYNIIVERDNINRAEYPASNSFIPADFRLILADKGYELYQN
ncbi:MAG: ArnT family glycosyltransferase [Ignavibacteria bacterium]